MKRLNLNDKSSTTEIVPEPTKLNFQNVRLKLAPKIEAHIDEVLKTKAASKPLTSESLEEETVAPLESSHEKLLYAE